MDVKELNSIIYVWVGVCVCVSLSLYIYIYLYLYSIKRCRNISILTTAIGKLSIQAKQWNIDYFIQMAYIQALSSRSVVHYLITREYMKYIQLSVYN